MSSAIKSVNRLIRAAVIMAVALVTFVACQDRVDESNMYTFTGKLMSGDMEEDEGLSDFLYLIKRVKLSDVSESTVYDLLSARGYGRLKILEFLGQTRRGRDAVLLFRYGK